MKKNIRIFFSLLCVTLLFGSCKNEVEDVFDQSSTARYEEYIAQCKSTLVADGSWWQMDYTTPTDYQTVFFFHFSEDNTLNMFDVKHSPTQYPAYYAFNRAQGPILVLQSTGGTPLTALAAYGSAKADIEYVIMDIQANEIVLKGRKSQDKVALTRWQGFQPVSFLPNMLNLNLNMAFVGTTENMSPVIKNAYDRVDNGITDRGRKLTLTTFTPNKTYGICLLFRSTRSNSTVNGYLSFSIIENENSELTLKFNGFTGSYDGNGKTYYDQYDGVAELVALLEGNYRAGTVSSNDKLATVRLVSTSDSNKWFDLVIRSN